MHSYRLKELGTYQSFGITDCLLCLNNHILRQDFLQFIRAICVMKSAKHKSTYKIMVNRALHGLTLENPEIFGWVDKH